MAPRQTGLEFRPRGWSKTKHPGSGGLPCGLAASGVVPERELGAPCAPECLRWPN